MFNNKLFQMTNNDFNQIFINLLVINFKYEMATKKILSSRKNIIFDNKVQLF